MADGQKKNFRDKSVRCPEFKNYFKFVSIASYSGGDFCTTNEKVSQTRTNIIAVIRTMEKSEEPAMTQ